MEAENCVSTALRISTDYATGIILMNINWMEMGSEVKPKPDVGSRYQIGAFFNRCTKL